MYPYAFVNRSLSWCNWYFSSVLRSAFLTPRSPFASSLHRTILIPTVDATERVITQGRALVCAIEAIGVIEPSAWFERAIAGLLLAAYKRRLRAIVAVAPTGVTDTLETSERIPDTVAALFGDYWGTLADRDLGGIQPLVAWGHWRSLGSATDARQAYGCITNHTTRSRCFGCTEASCHPA